MELKTLCVSIMAITTKLAKTLKPKIIMGLHI